MLSRLKAFYTWLHTHEGRKIFRYTMVSVISTGVSAIVIVLVYGVFHVWTEVPSTIFGNFVAAFPSYWLNRRWVWGKGGRSHLTKEIIPFWSLSAIGITFSVFGAAFAKHVGKVHHLSHLEQTALVVIANLLSFGIFWVLKFIIFNKLFHVHPLEELDELVEAA